MAHGKRTDEPPTKTPNDSPLRARPTNDAAKYGIGKCKARPRKTPRSPGDEDREMKTGRSRNDGNSNENETCPKTSTPALHRYCKPRFVIHNCE
jgi:hypothetical protein